ncbi:ABC transporter permease [uncultured Cohaesibacter sp.]|uniref:ABC transporter permease n=1 Tax=uncultured Cohaesibacter sp. TaxID=1002546 RepID=UPI0029C9A431|nr:ABC transporter permease [uncultured Cohaesibacter sp.]
MEKTNGQLQLSIPPIALKTISTLFTIVITMVGLLFITFIIGRVMPVDPVLAIVGERASQAQYDAAYIALGLDRPLLVQFMIYLNDVFHGNLGESIRTGMPVFDDIKRFFPATMELATIGTLIGIVVGIPLGVLAAVKRGTWIDQTARFIALIGYSIPVFWIGLVGLLIFYGILGWVGGPGRLDIFYEDMIPTVTGMILIDSLLAGDFEVFSNAFSHIVLPACILGYYSLAYISRMTRSFMLEQLNSEYIIAARVKGLSEARVIWQHAFRNIGVQLITVVALSYAGLLEGSVLTEIIFSWPGIGSYITTSLLSADMAAVLGGTVIVGLVFVCLNVLSDVLYRLLDPRSK